MKDQAGHRNYFRLLSMFCRVLELPEEELESADKGPEIIVPLYVLVRVESEAAEHLERGEGLQGG